MSLEQKELLENKIKTSLLVSKLLSFRLDMYWKQPLKFFFGIIAQFLERVWIEKVYVKVFQVFSFNILALSIVNFLNMYTRWEGFMILFTSCQCLLSWIIEAVDKPTIKMLWSRYYSDWFTLISRVL